MIRAVFASITAAIVALPAWAIDIQEVTSPGGINAWLVEEHEIPFVALEVRVRGGANLDLPGKRGATNFMVGLLEEGAGDLDARGFATALEDLATTFGYDTFDDEVSISARFLTENRDEAVDLLKLSLTQPTFDEASVERVRAQILSGIRSDLRDPDRIAARAFYAKAFDGHPYATAREGTEESVTGITRDDLVEAHARVFAQDRLVVSAVGDITAEELATLLDRLFGDLPETGSEMPGDADYQLSGGLSVVDFETPQSVAVFGHEGLPRDHPDFFPAFVLNHILGGGGFGSRLTEEVRVKRGLTYGISTYLAPRDHGALFLGQVASANDRIAESLDVIREEWLRAATEGVTQEELERAQTFLTGAYPLRFDGNARIAGILVGMQLTGLSTDYVNTRNDRVNAVTLDDIKRVAGTLLDPDALHFVVVGQPAGLEASN